MVDVFSKGFRIILVYQFSFKYLEKACRVNDSIENMVCKGQVDEYFDQLGQILASIHGEVQNTSNIWVR